MSTSLEDLREEGGSNCCGATVYNGMCAECKEHCEAVPDEEDKFDVEEPAEDTSPEAQIANKKLAREVQDEITPKETWYEHESPEPYIESNGNLPPGYSDRDL